MESTSIAEWPTTAEGRFRTLPARQSARDYNFEHFSTGLLVQDVQRTINVSGIQPGTLAPDFTLPDTDGGEVTLSGLRDRPVVLHFGSLS